MYDRRYYHGSTMEELRADELAREYIKSYQRVMERKALGLSETYYGHPIGDGISRKIRPGFVYQYSPDYYSYNQEQVKYNPNQPRVPAGNSNGGQWTSGGGGDGSGSGGDSPNMWGGSDFLDGGGNSGGFGGNSDNSLSFGDFLRGNWGGGGWNDGVLGDVLSGFGDSGSSNEPIAQVAGILEDRTVDLQKEENGPHGGHAIERHVGKSNEDLQSRFLKMRTYTEGLFYTEIRQPDGIGSFDSIESANDFVNRVINNNRAQLIRELDNPKYDTKPLIINERIGSVTGYEAWSPTLTGDPSMRLTHSVRVVLMKHLKQRDWRIISAFPYNMKKEKKDE